MKYVPVETIERFMKDVFVKLGVPEDDAKTCAEVLITSDLRGIESHGIGRLKMYYDRILQGIQKPKTCIDVIQYKKATAVWDGNHGMGHVIGVKAMQTAIDKAAEYGMGSVAVRNSTHYGIAGYYALMAVKNNMIGLTFTNARPSCPPLNGFTPLLGTNPICFGAPSDEPYPFLYDAATSISQRGKIEQLEREEKSTPPSWAINRQGEGVTDSSQLLVDLVEKKAALVPLGGIEEETGGHKGYGLSTMVEILCAALQEGSFLYQLKGKEHEKPAPYRLGHFFMALDISSYIEPARCREITGSIMRTLKNAEKLPGRNKICIAGEKEYYREQEVRRQGVPVNANLEKKILDMCRHLDIPGDFLT